MPIRGDWKLGASLDDPRRRRWLLLIEALKSLPMREALETARAAEAFVVTGPSGRGSGKLEPSEDVEAQSDEATDPARQVPKGYLH